MNDLFAKLDLPKISVDVERIRGDLHTNYGNHVKISYYKIKDLEYLKTIFTKEICKIPPSTMFYADIVGSGRLWPHRDHNVSCCINWYFDPNNATTVFYKEKENSSPWLYPGKETANIYEFQDVRPVGNFKAEPFESYLLNVSEIHAVFNPPPGVRRFLTWQWRPADASYQEVLENLNYSVL